MYKPIFLLAFCALSLGACRTLHMRDFHQESALKEPLPPLSLKVHAESFAAHFAAEMVREQLMLRLGEELPYSATVEIERFEEDGEMLRIAAVVWVEREGQKPIVIGKGGERLKAISTGARVGMEKLFGRKVFLETWCRVREGWSDDEAALRRFGYSE